jgi:hypothetical protein
MKSLKRIVQAIIYAVVGGFSGGVGAVIGSIRSIPKIFKVSIRFWIAMGCIGVLGDAFLETIDISSNAGILKLILMAMMMCLTLFFSVRVRGMVDIVVIVFGIISVFFSKEVWESIVRLKAIFQVSFFVGLAFLFASYFFKYALRGAAMGVVRGARGGALGGGLGGAISGMPKGIVYGFGFGMLIIVVITLFLRLLEKSREGFDGEYFWWIVLIFALFFALLGLIAGASSGARKYASKNIQKNDSLRDVCRSIFKYALRNARLEAISGWDMPPKVSNSQST